MHQWFLRITAYADELLDGLDYLDWPESAKRAQREWIGRSEGSEIDFDVPDKDLRLRVFTTRPDTLFGVSFLALPPEHPALETLAIGTEQLDEVNTFVAEALRERVSSTVRSFGVDAARAPSGVFTGSFAVHPATGERVPIYVADYVLATYGTGAVMGVPAHDGRDFRFAEANGLPVVQVIRPTGAANAPKSDPWTGDGVLIDSARFTGMPSELARDAIAEWLEARGVGRRAVRYRLRDWLISRQRYWGPPIPIVYCDDCGTVPVPEADLPVILPDVADFRPTGTGLSPLATAESFIHTTCPSCGTAARRETDVSDTFLDSAWYFLRYPSSDVDDRPWDLRRTERMLPVDSYAGGPEHVMRHHLYARFLTRALHDLDLVPFPEPFPRLRLHGMLTKDGAKMSKSRGNVVNPDRYVADHGADITRMHLLFIGPWDEGGDFSDAGIAGIERFLRRIWRLITEPHQPGRGNADLRTLDRTIAVVAGDIEKMRFNTAIASLMGLVRWVRHEGTAMSSDQWARVSSSVVLILAPFAPHLAEELWSKMGGDYSVHEQGWPAHDPNALRTDRVTVAIQVDGKTRDRMEVPAGTGRDDALDHALASERVQRHLGRGSVADVIYVQDRLINLVTR
jgi:leucyl-tRNA synthetase